MLSAGTLVRKGSQCLPGQIEEQTHTLLLCKEARLLVRGWMLVERIKMFHCLLSSLEQGVDGVGDHPQVWTRNSPPGTSLESYT